MIRTLILLACAASLTGCKDFTSGVDSIQHFMRDDAPAAFVETVAVERPSSLEVVTVAEPEPEVCEVRMWRFMLLDCHDNNLGPAPGYE